MKKKRDLSLTNFEILWITISRNFLMNFSNHISYDLKRLYAISTDKNCEIEWNILGTLMTFLSFDISKTRTFWAEFYQTICHNIKIYFSCAKFRWFYMESLLLFYLWYSYQYVLVCGLWVIFLISVYLGITKISRNFTH